MLGHRANNLKNVSGACYTHALLLKATYQKHIKYYQNSVILRPDLVPGTVKVDSESHTVYVDDELDDVEGVDELRAELPEHQPRFVIYSCRMEHSDGRVSFPMVFIFSTPKGQWLPFQLTGAERDKPGCTCRAGVSVLTRNAGCHFGYGKVRAALQNLP